MNCDFIIQGNNPRLPNHLHKNSISRPIQTVSLKGEVTSKSLFLFEFIAIQEHNSKVVSGRVPTGLDRTEFPKKIYLLKLNCPCNHDSLWDLFRQVGVRKFLFYPRFLRLSN